MDPAIRRAFVLSAFIVSTAAILLPWSVHPAGAADILMPGKIIVAKENTVLKGIFKPTTPFPLPTSDLSTGVSVEITVFDTFSTGGSFSETLANGAFPQGWKALGNPAGSKGYKYKNTAGGVDGGPPCKVAIIKPNIVKFVCKKDAVNIPAAPFAGDVGVVIDINSGEDRYCGEFTDADEKKNDQLGSGLHLLKRKGTGAPGMCPTVAPTTTSTSSTSSTSTSSTSTSATSTSSTTSTIIGGCCSDATHLSFDTVSGGGPDCGDLLLFNGTSFGDVACDGLYFGGGGNSVPLPATLPDMGSAVNEITSCLANVATLGNTTSGDTGSNRNCTSIGCLFGAPLSIPNPTGTPTSTCVINTVAMDSSGTLDCSNGDTVVDIPLTSEVFLTGDTDGGTAGIQPCPVCDETFNTCNGGANSGAACTAGTSGSGTLGVAYPTSHDCNPAATASLGGLPIGFALTNGTVEYNSTAGTGPNATQARVFCGFCRHSGTLAFDPAAVACIDDLTTPNACAGLFPDCEQRSNGAFGPAGGGVRTIIANGTGSTISGIGVPTFANLVSVFCIPPTFNASVDSAGDLPGPGAAAIPGSATLCSAASPCP